MCGSSYGASRKRGREESATVPKGEVSESKASTMKVGTVKPVGRDEEMRETYLSETVNVVVLRFHARRQGASILPNPP